MVDAPPTDLLAQGYLWAFLSVFAGGVLTSLTPCVYPLIPITVSLFGGRGENVSRARAVGLAGCYVGGIGTMYAALGVFSALAGRAFGTHMASPWVMGPIAVLFLGMAASMFGAFELSLPHGLATRLSEVGGKGVWGSFAMGLVGGIIAAPCTGPVLASVLAWVATTRSALMGATLLFTYALGMGVLFFVIAAFAVSLPKSGRWMESVKSVFGIFMLIGALYFLRNILPALADVGERSARWLWGSLAVATAGVLVGGVHLSFHDAPLRQLRKALGVLLATAGLFGAVQYLLVEDAQASRELRWVHGEAQGVAAARAARRPALLDFYADWCLPCKELEAHTFHHPEVRRELQRLTLVKIDCSTDDDPVVVATKARYHADTLPTVILLDAEGRVRHKIDRVIEPAELLPLLRGL